jgi:hypothetical protein
VVDHLEQRFSRGGVQVHAVVDRDANRRERVPPGPARRLVGGKARPVDAVLVQREADGHRSRHLDGRSANLTIALREVEVADREQRARHLDRHPDAAARDELTDVHVPSGLARRDRP